MVNITTEHLQHLARRNDRTQKQFDKLRAKFATWRGKFLTTGSAAVGTIETGAGAWFGGAIEGRTGGGTILRVPINLGIGVILATVGHFGLMGRASGHLSNVGNGFLGSYIAATGYAFGKRWRETGKLLGGGGHPWTSPYENGWPKMAEAPVVHGDVSEAQMAQIVERMQQVAAQG